MRKYLLTSLVSALVASAGASMAGEPTLAERPLDEKSFRHWLDFIRPKGEELAFQAIAWRTTFQDAVLEAQEADKPILLWAMNGHPLSCT